MGLAGVAAGVLVVLLDEPSEEPEVPLLQWLSGEPARHNEAAFAAPRPTPNPERKTQ